VAKNRKYGQPPNPEGIATEIASKRSKKKKTRLHNATKPVEQGGRHKKAKISGKPKKKWVRKSQGRPGSK